jgi:hypothetical protein
MANRNQLHITQTAHKIQQNSLPRKEFEDPHYLRLSSHINKKTKDMWDPCEVTDWIQLAQDTVLSQTLVNIAMNFGFHRSQGFS